MINRCRMGIALAVLLTAAVTADASSATLEIRADGSTTKNRLIIPKNLLDSARIVASLDAAPQDENRMRTIFAGIALSLASIVLVFVLLRRKSAATKTAASLFFVGAVMVAAAEMATADIAPKRRSVVRSWKHVSQQDVEVEISETGDHVVLILGTYYRRARQPREDYPKPKTPSKTGAAPRDKGASRPPKRSPHDSARAAP